MKIKRISAKDTRSGIRRIKELLGEDAVIIANRKLEDGVELVAAVDIDQGLLNDDADVKLEPLERSKNTAVQPIASNIVKPPVPKVPSATELSEIIQNRINETRASASSKTILPFSKTQNSQPSTRPLPKKVSSISPATTKNFSELDQRIQSESKLNPANKNFSIKHSDILKMQKPLVRDVQREIRELRELMQCQMSYMGWGKWSSESPDRANLLRQLTDIGLGTGFCKKIMRSIGVDETKEKAWRRALGIWAHHMPIKEDDILKSGGVIALIGPTGVGKTTTAAKLAVRYASQYGRQSVAMVSYDNQRIGAHEQLMSLGRLLRISAIPAASSAELSDIVGGLQNKKLVIIDCAGVHQNDKRLQSQLKLLRQLPVKVRNYLVLSSNTQMDALEETASAYSGSKLRGCILTKLDEAASLGGVLTVIARHKLAVSYVTQGQNIKEDIEPAKAHRLVSRAVALSRYTKFPLDEHSMAVRYGDIAAGAAV